MDKININSFAAPQFEEIYRTVGDVTITIRRGVPYGEAMENIQWAVNQLVDDRPFASTPIQKIITDLALLRTFTNIDLADVDELSSPEQLYAIYDIVSAADLVDEVRPLINAAQLAFIEQGISGAVDNIIKYRNSAAGILATMGETSNLNNAKIQEMLQMLQDPAQFAEAKRFAKIYEEMTISPAEG